jgi:hypothetical protein
VPPAWITGVRKPEATQTGAEETATAITEIPAPLASFPRLAHANSLDIIPLLGHYTHSTVRSHRLSPMPALYPPEYPYRPDAPLLSFGPSFSEEIAGSVLRATWHENDEQPHEGEIRAAASLTMLEGFHPRDHLECMMAAQGVALHCAGMDSLARAVRPGQSDAMVLKFRASAAAMSRAFLATTRELDRRQSKPLPLVRRTPARRRIHRPLGPRATHRRRPAGTPPIRPRRA